MGRGHDPGGGPRLQQNGLASGSVRMKGAGPTNSGLATPRDRGNTSEA
jgi:hypothetical protein